MTKTEPNNHVPNGVVCVFVSYCNRNKVFVRVAKGIDTFFLEKEQITTIRLTPEILEKNGWKHKKEFGEYWFIPRNEDYELLALDKVGEEWAIYIEENCSNFEYIKFVHQLQHLLFGLGIKHEMEV